MSIKVKLRQKAISGNRQSLYLDFYPAIIHPITGELTRREFLGMYIYDRPKNPIDKLHNTETLSTAESIRQKKQNELDKPEIYTAFEKEQLRLKEIANKCFIKYFKDLTSKRKGSNYDNWTSSLNYLEAFTKGNLKFADLNENFCNDFKDYLLTTKSIRSAKMSLSQNSAVSYFNKFKAGLKQAYKDGYLNYDLNVKIGSIKDQDVIKQTLTIEELNILAKSDCKHPYLKKVVFFSALTGLPYMEMKNLTWKYIETSDSFGIRIKMIRQKTHKEYFINIGQQAFELLGDRKGNEEKVFPLLKNKDRYSFFTSWLDECGIKKKMTFHDLRHSYAVNQIDAGTDLYTLQGLMGHSTSRQTTGYAKISDQRKREAADKVKIEL